MKKQFLISHCFNLRTPDIFSEFVTGPQSTHQLFINGERVSFMIDFKDQTLDVLPKIENVYESFTYKTSILVDLHHYDYLPNDPDLIPTGESTFHLGGDFDIKVILLKKRHLYNVCHLKMMAVYNKILIPCHYHCLPLKNYRLFVLQIEKSIYFINVSVPVVNNCTILCKLTDSPNAWKKYLLDYSHDFGTLKIIKDFGDCMKIVKEIPIDESLSQ
jgi:hypothetical protein